MYQFMDFFKDKKGHIVIFQMPNKPLIGWFVFMILNLLWSSDQPKMHALFELLSYGFLFTWAWLEITDYVSHFRCALGLIVMITTVYLHLY